ncbi:MAG: RNHCP domain-containing protein [Proteobacteria bacterium]|nr:RNHCP domain-containing protein [Pseudomonadota bacterium]
MTKRFQRTIESFTCEHCGTAVQGNGYTNHCPQCLWSKHVDKNPGDRAEGCHGAMQPTEVLVRGTEYTIVHRCVSCGAERKIKSHPEDNFETLLAVARGNRAI